MCFACCDCSNGSQTLLLLVLKQPFPEPRCFFSALHYSTPGGNSSKSLLCKKDNRPKNWKDYSKTSSFFQTTTKKSQNGLGMSEFSIFGFFAYCIFTFCHSFPFSSWCWVSFTDLYCVDTLQFIKYMYNGLCLHVQYNIQIKKQHLNNDLDITAVYHRWLDHLEIINNNICWRCPMYLWCLSINSSSS